MIGKKLFLLGIVMSVENAVNLLDGVEKRADGTILVEGINHERNVLAHIDFAVPFSVEEGRPADRPGWW